MTEQPDGLTEYRHGTLVIWPTDHIRERVNALRAHYDPMSAAISEAHITLTQPFLAQPTVLDWECISTVVRTHASFRISFGPLRTFHPYPCVYLAIEPEQRILGLRHALHRLGLFNLELPHSGDFIPHMTISDAFVGVERTKQIFAELRDSAPAGTFDVTDIAYVRPDDSNRFHVARRLQLVPLP